MAKQRVVVTGGTGVVGKEVVKQLIEAGKEVVVLTRNDAGRPADSVRFLTWDGRSSDALHEVLAGAQSVVHLAGENVGQRWTQRTRKAILDSRVLGGKAVKEAVNRLPQHERPAVIAASAIGWYANAPDWQDENAPAGTGFLAEVVQAWEAALEGIETRLVTFRIGVVLSRQGGALGKLEPLFRWGFGSAVGSGEQWQSWVHVRDLARMVVHAVDHPQVQGTFNAVAPNPVTNRTLSRELARAMRRPFWAPAPPAWMLRAVLGDMAQITLDSQRIRSIRLTEAGFNFHFTDVVQALRDLYSNAHD